MRAVLGLRTGANWAQCTRPNARSVAVLSRFFVQPTLSYSSSPSPSPVTPALTLRQLSTATSPALRRQYATTASSSQLDKLKKSANDKPEDEAAQAALFESLLQDTDAKSQQELVDRFEELTGFWSGEMPKSTQAIKSDALFRSYLQALAAVAAKSQQPQPFTKLYEAPGRRQVLLQPAQQPAPVAPAPSIATPVSSLAQPAATSSATVHQLFAASGQPSTKQTEPIRVIVEEQKSSGWARAVRFILVTAVYSFLLLSLLSLLIDSSGILRNATASSGFQPVPPTTDDSGKRGTTFADVHGCEEAKAELFEVVEFLKDPERFENLGGRLPRGILLTGPPGTGKTLLARAVAGEAGVNFFSASGSAFDEMYVGVGARRIRELFAAARKAAPAIIFIDELDAIGGKRSPRDQHYVKQTLNQLLVELDGFAAHEGIILIGATNLPESLDKALVRPGRFDRHIAVPLPDVMGRRAILSHFLDSVRYEKGTVDVTTLARSTIGFSGADLQALVNQAAVKASADGAPVVNTSHFDWARERILMGSARKSAFVTEQGKLKTAYHEGGHALVALYSPGSYPLQSITIVPRGMALGYTLLLPHEDKQSHTLSEYRAKLAVAMGGRIAEEIIYGRDNVSDGASSDISNATNIATSMVRKFGFSDKVGPVAHDDNDAPASPETQALIDDEIKSLIVDAQTFARRILTEKREELERLAKALMEHETLTESEVSRVIKGEKLEHASSI